MSSTSALSLTPTRQGVAIDVAIAVALFGITIAVFWPALGGDFVAYDDRDYVFDPRTQLGLTLANIGRAFTEILASNYHPITWLAHMVDVDLFGADARGHHVGNIVLHAINGVLVFGVLRRLTFERVVAGVLALFFVVHPLRVESVAWIAERKDVLCACFYLLAVVEWLGARRAAVIVVASVLASLSKPMAVSLPVVFALHELVMRGASVRETVRRVAPWVVVAGLLAVATLVAQREAMKAMPLPLSMRVQTMFAAQVSHYLNNTLLPGCLHAPYLYPSTWPVPVLIAGIVVVVLLVVVAIVLRRRVPAFSFGIAWYFVVMLPTSGIIMVGVAPAADRYTYLPTVGLLIAIAALLTPVLVARRRLVAVVGIVGVVVAAGLTMTTRTQIAVWSSTTTLYANTLRCEPDNALVLESAAADDYSSGRLRDAMLKLQHASRVQPDNISSWTMQGLVAMTAQAYPMAHDAFVEARRRAPTDSLAQLGDATARFGMGEREALVELDSVVVDDINPFRLRRVAEVLEKLGEPERAARLRKIAGR